MSENLNIDITLNSWIEIVIRQWQTKINHLDIGVTGQLFNSFKFDIIKNAGGEQTKIDFFYKVYGRYVDMGVGKEFYIGNPGDIGGHPKRKPKRWYSPVIMGESFALRDIMKAKYGIIGAGLISEMINQADDIRNAGKTKKSSTNRISYAQWLEIKKKYVR